MKKKNWILPFLAVVLVAAGFFTFAFSSPTSDQKQKDNSTCCQQQKLEECKGKMNDSIPPGILIPENLFRQFLTITTLGY
jgi:hypothetical protein